VKEEEEDVDLLYDTYGIPWTAFGAEITQDFKERNNLRLIGALVAYPLVALCNSGPMMIINWGMPRGLTIRRCWHITGALGAILTAILIFVSWRTTRGREIVLTPEEIQKARDRNILKHFKEILSLRTYRIIVLTGLIYLIGFTMFNSAGVYLLTHNAQLEPARQGIFWLIYSAFAMAFAPIPVAVANRIGRKQSFLIFGFLFVASALAFFFIGIHGMTEMLTFAALVALSTSSFWGLYYCFIFDIAELDEFKNNARREGSIVALAQFFGKFGGALATLLVGIMLQFFGYTGTGVESPETLRGILAVSTLFPGAIVLVSMLIFIAYPLTRGRFEALKTAIALRKAGKEYSTDGFKKVL